MWRPLFSEAWTFETVGGAKTDKSFIIYQIKIQIPSNTLSKEQIEIKNNSNLFHFINKGTF